MLILITPQLTQLLGAVVGGSLQCVVEHMLILIQKLLLPPKAWDFIIFAITDVALVGVAHSLLSPEGTIVLHIYLVSHEEWSRLQI